MGTYTVRDPSSGKTLTLKGDSPPNEQELNDIFSKVNQPSDWKGVVGSALKEASFKPGTVSRGMMGPPGIGDTEMQANALPAMMGTVGGVAPIPGGATLGTAGGQALRDLTMKYMNKPVPGVMQHGLELGGAVLGDVAAFPALKRAHYGGEIGRAEKAAGVVTRAPTKAVTPGSVGETLNNLEAQLDAGMINTPQTARDAKAVISQVYKNPKIYEQTGDISVQAARVSKKTTDILNKLIPDRVAPAQAMAKGMVVPNAIKKGYMAAPWALRHGAEGAIGAGLGWELIKKVLGIPH